MKTRLFISMTEFYILNSFWNSICLGKKVVLAHCRYLAQVGVSVLQVKGREVRMGEWGQFLFAKIIGTSPIIVVQAKNNLSVFFIITFRNVTHLSILTSFLWHIHGNLCSCSVQPLAPIIWRMMSPKRIHEWGQKTNNAWAANRVIIFSIVSW